jgi:hypothetical protein
MQKKEKIISKEESQKVRNKSSLSQEETNSLEQMIEKDEEKMDLSEIKEILRESKTEKSSPSLQKVNAPQRVPTRLEANIVDTPTPNDTPRREEDDSFKYIQGETRTGEAKYVRYEGKIIDNMISRREIENIKIESPFESKTVGFENSPQTRISVQESFSKYTPVNKIDIEKLGKEKPFQKKEIKYNPEKY